LFRSLLSFSFPWMGAAPWRSPLLFLDLSFFLFALEELAPGPTCFFFSRSDVQFVADPVRLPTHHPPPKTFVPPSFPTSEQILIFRALFKLSPHPSSFPLVDSPPRHLSSDRLPHIGPFLTFSFVSRVSRVFGVFSFFFPPFFHKTGECHFFRVPPIPVFAPNVSP